MILIDTFIMSCYVYIISVNFHEVLRMHSLVDLAFSDISQWTWNFWKTLAVFKCIWIKGDMNLEIKIPLIFWHV